MTSQLCCCAVFSHVHLFKTLWTVARRAPLSTGFSRQEYWSGLPFPPPRDLPDPGMETIVSCDSWTGRQILYLLSHLGSPLKFCSAQITFICRIPASSQMSSEGRCSEQQMVVMKVMFCYPFPIFGGFQEYFIVPLILSWMRGVVVTCRNPAYLGSSDFGKLSTSDFNINIRGLQAPALKRQHHLPGKVWLSLPLPRTAMDVRGHGGAVSGNGRQGAGAAHSQNRLPRKTPGAFLSNPS